MKTLLTFMITIFYLAAGAQFKDKKTLQNILGKMPLPPPLKVDTLERTKLNEGWRYKIRYLSEDSNALFHTAKDYISAYLFIPDHKKNEKLPAIIAIHQDGAHSYLGKSEPAGLAGDQDQHYGLELFKRGYIVICPDRFYHSVRRKISNPDTLADLWKEELLRAMDFQAAQLLNVGRTTYGKEVYDLQRSMDVLYATPVVDRKHIGAIGHSAGGNIIAYFMFADQRVKLGVSSCGIFEHAEWYDEKVPMKRFATTVIPNFILTCKTADFVGFIAPRPLLLTRGNSEWGTTGKYKIYSEEHVKSTERLYQTAMKYYERENANDKLKVVYFDEDKGRHAFPPKVKEGVYTWIDSYLKKQNP